jgi:hypothetical protein
VSALEFDWHGQPESCGQSEWNVVMIILNYLFALADCCRLSEKNFDNSRCRLTQSYVTGNSHSDKRRNINGQSVVIEASAVDERHAGSGLHRSFQSFTVIGYTYGTKRYRSSELYALYHYD